MTILDAVSVLVRHKRLPVSWARGGTFGTVLTLAGALMIPVCGTVQLAGQQGAAGATGPQSVTGLSVPSAAGSQGPTGAQRLRRLQGVQSLQSPAASSGSADMGSTSTDITLYNVIFGAKNAIPTGDSDTVFGVAAGQSLTSGREMTIVGANACANFTGNDPGNNSPSENGLTTCIGSYAGFSLLAPSIDNVFIGQKAGESVQQAGSDTLVGVHAGTQLISGEGDTIIGAHSFDGSGTPSLHSAGNTVVGAGIGDGVGDKQYLTAVGTRALASLQTGSGTLALGIAGSQLLETTDSILLGALAAGTATTADNVLVIGNYAAKQAPSRMVAVGNHTAEYATAPGTFVGYSAGGHLSSGINNACFGDSACSLIQTGSNNTVLGQNSGSEMSNAESNNTIVGANATTANGVNDAGQFGAGENSVPNSLNFHYVQIVDGNGDLHSSTRAPQSGDPCTVGALRAAAGYVYACASANHWMRSQLVDY